MTGYATASGEPLTRPEPLRNLRALQTRFFWLIGASGSIVFIEPSPYEVVMALAVVFFFATGPKITPLLLVPLGLLTGINIGYSIGAANLFGDTKVFYWVLTSWYMAMTAMFFACALLEDTRERLTALSRGYVFGAVIASLAGIGGFFNLIPGAQDLLTFGMRAKGTFKDPNVLGAFLIYPAVYCMQQVIEGPFWKAVRNAAVFGLIAITIFLAFSRGAWGVLAGAMLMATALMFLTAPSLQRRMRIVTLVLAAAACIAVAVMFLLSSDYTASLFNERASLDQPYDTGRFGRFGRHILGAAMALDYPFGIGPLQFHRFFPEDTHNSFLNAFMSGGWISGVLYPALIFTTIIYGARYLFTRTPWQGLYIVVYSTLFMMIMESLIIDTDHWRHYYMLLGATWGVIAASARWTATTRDRAS